MPDDAVCPERILSDLEVEALAEMRKAKAEKAKIAEEKKEL